jgi:hypothetical protein
VRLGKLRRRAWAAWLGLLALALNTLVPVHLAFDLAEALGTAQQHGAHVEARGPEWRLLALLIGHCQGDGKPSGHDQDHRAACPVFNSVGALAGFVAPAPLALSLPVTVTLAAALPLIERELPAAPVAAYRSRAPPVT